MRLNAKYPNGCCVVHCNNLAWRGDIKPSALSRAYKIKVFCHGFKMRPRVILYGENVQGLSRVNFPHHFNIDNEKGEVVLCLHMSYEFDYRYHWIADTIIPWTQEWLYYYEMWLATGEWYGGGHAP